MATRRSATLSLLVLVTMASGPWNASEAATGLFSVASTDDQLRAIDPATGRTTSSVKIKLQNDTDTVQGATGLAKDPTTGLLYALLKLQSAPACRPQPPPNDPNPLPSGGKQSRLVTIDPTNGNVSDVGNTGDCFAGITFHLDGTLYGVTGDGAAVPSRLYSLNKSTGAKTGPELKALSNPPGNDDGGEAIAFNPNDGLIYRMSGGFNNQVFETINPATGFAIGNKTLSGDGYIESLAMTDIPGNTNTLLFTDNANLFTITTGGFVTVVAGIDHFAKGLVSIDNFVPTPSGFEMVFDGPVGGLQLYGIGTRQANPPNVTVVGANTGPVTGSLVVDRTKPNMITFVRTGGILLPDVYTVTLRNFTVNGEPFDGDFVRPFAVLPTNAVVVSVPDFAVGPGQPVNLPPASGLGIPINLSQGSGITNVALTLLFDPALLSITGIVPGSLPAGAVVQALDVTSRQGAASLIILAPNGLGTGPVTLVRLSAQVPVPSTGTTTYRAMNLLSFETASLNSSSIPAIADDAVHVAAFIGDTTGNGGYSSLDGQRVLRVVAGLDSGFAAFPLVDPVIIGDVTANGALSSLDGTRILQEAAGLDQREIPPLPGTLGPASAINNR